ncbi:ras-related and estrogen-regulated growth inhibitor-like protein [Alosa pseudoharengus]|uniref:ras-related and estrogen-regulated growth inhibitor-like protein n=1 Tax=Alosa pseudoharengus TaxID=34774 RepID=UPI003F8C3765
MNNIKLALLGSQGTEKSAVLVRFLTKCFIGEYASNASENCHWREMKTGPDFTFSIFETIVRLLIICNVQLQAYHKRLSIDGRQLNLEVFDPCSEQVRCVIYLETVDWADGFVVVYNSDRSSFLHAIDVLRQIKEARVEPYKGEVPVCLFGNKQDLCHARQVNEEDGRSLKLDNNCHFQEVSASEGYQEVENLFT